MRFQRVIWSPVEEDYLREHRGEEMGQLTIALSKSVTAIKRKLNEIDGKVVRKPSPKRAQGGKRADIVVNGKPLFVRSAWEANICRWLTHQGYPWAYEPTVFSFLEHGVKRGTVSYCPDFRVTTSDGDLWLEVKGYLDQRGRAALNRFKKYYPQEFERLHAIVGRSNSKAGLFFRSIGVPIMGCYSDLNRDFKDVIEGWE
jgi:hypothetical protein